VKLLGIVQSLVTLALLSMHQRVERIMVETQKTLSGLKLQQVMFLVKKKRKSTNQKKLKLNFNLPLQDWGGFFVSYFIHLFP
jgi:hypothetical protein